MLQAFVEQRGDGSCGNSMPLAIPTVSPAAVARVVRPYLSGDTPVVQVEDALELVAHYEVSALAEPLRAWYEARLLDGTLRPETAVQVLSALVQVAPRDQRPWVDAEVERRLDQDLRAGFRTGALIWPFWDRLLFHLADHELYRSLQAEALAEATSERQRLPGDEGIGWRRQADWARNTSERARYELELRLAVSALPADRQLSALIAHYADAWASRDLLRAWAAHELRRRAATDGVAPVVAALREVLPSCPNDVARVRVYDALRYFGATLSPGERDGELGAIRAVTTGLAWFELSHRSSPPR